MDYKLILTLKTTLFDDRSTISESPPTMIISSQAAALCPPVSHCPLIYPVAPAGYHQRLFTHAECSLPCLTPGDSHSPKHYVSDQPASCIQTHWCTAANPRLNPRIASFSMALGKGTCPAIGLSTKPAFPATQSLHLNSHAATHSWHSDDVTTQPAADLKSPPTIYLFVYLFRGWNDLEKSSLSTQTTPLYTSSIQATDTQWMS